MEELPTPNDNRTYGFRVAVALPGATLPVFGNGRTHVISVLTPTPSRVIVPSATNETKQDLCWIVSIKASAKPIRLRQEPHLGPTAAGPRSHSAVAGAERAVPQHAGLAGVAAAASSRTRRCLQPGRNTHRRCAHMSWSSMLRPGYPGPAAPRPLASLQPRDASDSRFEPQRARAQPSVPRQRGRARIEMSRSPASAPAIALAVVRWRQGR